jgi:tetratricopeptide (TPR) repeat protein
MKRILLILIPLLLLPMNTHPSPNCNVYKLNKNQPCYDACYLVTEMEAPQGSRASQLNFDKAIELCPTFDYAYSEKAVPYLKNGDFITWKKLIDKAVELNPTGQLGYRGWCRYQFVKDYTGAIEDLEKLTSLLGTEIGYSINGDYHLNIAKALCYKAIGQKAKAIEIIEHQLAQKGYSPLAYDYLHLGVLKMETGDLVQAIACLQKSISLNDSMAEPYYYLGLIYKMQHMKTEYVQNMEKSKDYYIKGNKRTDPYTQPMDKIYLVDIEKELQDR